MRRILRVDRLLDLPVGPDHVREALRVLVLRTLARLVREPDLALRVAQEREPVPELLGERLVLLRRVERDAEHGDALRLVVADSITEPAALLRSPRRVGLGEEPEHDALAAQIRELHLPTEVILHLEIRRHRTDGEHGTSSFREQLAEEVLQHCDERSPPAWQVQRHGTTSLASYRPRIGILTTGERTSAFVTKASSSSTR